VEADDFPRITSMDAFDASLQAESVRLSSQFNNGLLMIQRLIRGHTKFGGKNYAANAVRATEREREQRQADITRRREQLDRDRQAIEELERSLPGGPRPTRRARR
jgi:hypothetical protein